MGIRLDTLPNHMGIGNANNAWWMDVLESGPSSIYAPFFDIDWHPVAPELENRILLPMLEDQYGKVLQSGKLRLAHEDGAFFIYYHQMKLPVAPDTYSSILEHQFGTLMETLGGQDENIQGLQSILTALNYLAAYTERNPDKIAERNREKEVIKRRIAALYQASPE